METKPQEARAVPPAEGSTLALTKLLAAGDENAFRRFHEIYFPRVYRFVMILTRGDESAAEEAVQETFSRVARYVRAFDQEEVFWCWIAAVARSAVRDGGRKQKRYSKLLQLFATRNPSPEPPNASETVSVLEEALGICLDKLDANDRELLEAKYFLQASTRKLALQSGLTEKAVESRLARLRRHLREKVLRQAKALSK